MARHRAAILLVEEPTRVDVGARAEIYRHCASLLTKLAIVFVSLTIKRFLARDTTTFFRGRLRVAARTRSRRKSFCGCHYPGAEDVRFIQ